MILHHLTVLVLLGSLLVQVPAQTEEKPTYPGTYLILSSNTIRPGFPLTLSITVYETVGGADVQLSSSITKGNQVIVESLDMVRTGTSQVTLQVPTNSVAGPDYNLQVVARNGLDFNETRSLEFNVEHFSIFVQSDKAIYKPGQTVRFRVMAVYPNLRPYLGPFSVSVIDANQNTIEQWLDRQPNKNGIISDEMVMSDYPVLGEWTIKAQAEGQTYEYTIQIEEYVLPKFEVTVTLPAFMDLTYDSVPVSISAQYTYGKPVEGTYSLRASIQYYSETVELNGEIDGTQVMTITRNQLLAIKRNNQYNSRAPLYDSEKLWFTANVTESLTGITQNSEASTLANYNFPVKVVFSESVSRSNYKPGLPYQAYLVVSHQDGSPLTDAEREQGLSLCVSYGYTQECTTQTETIAPGTGVVEAFIPTRNSNEQLQIKAEYTGLITPARGLSIPTGFTTSNPGEYRTSTSKYLSTSTSISGTFIQVRAQDASALRVGSQASFLVESTIAPGSVTYQVVSRGNVLQSAMLSVTGTTHTLALDISADMAPKSKLIVSFINQEGEVVLDSLEFVVDVVFDNPVAATFSLDSAEPGDGVSFDVETTPGAFVGVLAIDRSVLLLADGNDITRDQVLQSVGKFDTTPENRGDYNPFFDVRWCFVPYYTSGSSVGQVLRNAGIIYMTDGNVFSDQNKYDNVYFDFGPELAMAMPGAMPDVNEDSSSRTSENSVVPESDIRKEFPETWLWVDTEADSSGRVSIQTHFPDTITQWVGTAISMDTTTGLGVTENAAQATVFKNFFVSLNLPYSVIRGEKFVLGATVFNYRDTTITANVQLQSSKDYYILNFTNSIEKQLTTPLTKSVSIPANKGVTVNFPIEPTKTGMMELVVTATSGLEQDGVRRFLLVEPEGIAQEYVSSDLVDFSTVTGGAYSKRFDIDLPTADVVPDSIRATITATGDILGPTMSNLDQLLRMPTGCGEQTMISFAPDVFVYKYLRETNQANSAIETKALNFMKMGYQRELTYQHGDGSFSAWGDRNGDPGSTWLTAFVVRSFLQAEPFIYIDPSKMETAVQFLLNRQQRDGSYEAMGRIVDKGIEGGVASVETLTAYVAIAMYQASISDILSRSYVDRAQTSLGNAMLFLASRYSALQEDKYAMALVTYALTLGRSPTASVFRARLDELRTSEGEGTLAYWTDQDQQTTPANDDFYYWVWRGPPSAAIEMTGYGMLGYLATDDVTASVPVARWLSQQRNSLGGYSSTQDTVIALFALTEYASRINANDKNMNLAITTSEDSSYQETFQIFNNNSIVLQQFELPVERGSVTVSGSGMGTFLLSFILNYNLNEVRSNEVFDVTITISNEKMNSLTITACGSYTGGGEGTGMAIMDIGLPSGFYALEDALTRVVREHQFATKYEIIGQSTVIYFNEIPSTEVCIVIDAQRSKSVAETKPSVVRVYDYYNPTDQTVRTYSSSSLAETKICDLCPDCCGLSAGSALPSSSTSVVLLLTLALVSIIGTYII